MKNYILTTIVLLFAFNLANAQINTPSSLSTTITGKHAFIDASDYGINWSSNESKGLVFPQTDLTQWVFQTEKGLSKSIVNSSAVDLMVVFGPLNTMMGLFFQLPMTEW